MQNQFWEKLAFRPTACFQSGGFPRFLPLGPLLRKRDHDRRATRLLRAVSQSVMYRIDESELVRSHTTGQLAALETISQIIQRSELCPPHPNVEAHIRKTWEKPILTDLHEQGSSIESSDLTSLPIDVVIALIMGWTRSIGNVNKSPPLVSFDDESGSGARKERPRWLEFQEHQGGLLSHWVHPQVFIKLLSGQSETDDFRRVDFLVCPPWADALVWEVHGKFDQKDKEKDREIRNLDFSTFNEIVDNTSEADISKQLAVLTECRDSVISSQHFNQMLDAVWVASQVDLGLFAILSSGMWSRDHPIIHLKVPDLFQETARLASECFTELITACEKIWSIDEGSLIIDSSMSLTYQGDADLVLHIDPYAPPYCSAEDQPIADIEIRRIFLPRDFPVWHPWTTGEELNGVRPSLSPPEESFTPLIRRCFNHDSLRPGQYRGIVAATKGADALVLLPTGHGKSLIFQLAALILPGATLVIEAWRALIDDQVRVLQDRGIGRVTAIHKDKRLEGDLLSALIIYIAPERIYVEGFQKPLNQLLREVGLDLLVIDEAHAVSEAGHSFRPSYLGLVDRIGERCNAANRNRPPTLALTATAANIVVRDIRGILNIEAPPITLQDETSGMAFVRENLLDEILEVDSAEGETAIQHALDQALQDSRCVGQGIVFCVSKRKWSKTRPRWYGVDGTLPHVERYHSNVSYYKGGNDMTMKERTEQINNFVTAKSNAMVATNAFGAGIDLPNIRWIVNLGLPAGLEAYYQQLGRAGRDGEIAVGFLIVDSDSNELREKLIAARQEPDSFDILREVISNRKDSGLGSIARQLSLFVGRKAGEKSLGNGSAFNLIDRPSDSFLPSFPGWELEAESFDRPLVTQLFKAGSNSEVVFEFHSAYDEFVWKAVNRARVLGLISGSYRRTFPLQGLSKFVLTTANLEEASELDHLEGRLRDFVARLRGYRVGREVAEKLHSVLQSTEPPSEKNVTRIGHVVKKMLSETYEAVRDSRLGSLDGLRTYYTTRDQDKRHQHIEDYFRRDTFVDEMTDLCEEAQTPANWADALAATKREGVFPIGVFDRLRIDFPNTGLPNFLLIVGLLMEDRLDDARLPLNVVFVDDQTPIETQEWAWRTLMYDLGTKVRLNANQIFIQMLMSVERGNLVSKKLYEKFLLWMRKDFGDEEIWHLSLAKWIEDTLEASNEH